MTSGHHNAALPVPTSAIPSSGIVRVRARYCECDPMGVVHHAAYIPWLELGRTELLREAGVSYAQIEAAGYYLVVAQLECSYRRPGRYDDLVEVRTRVSGGSRVKITHEYEVALVERVGEGRVEAGQRPAPRDGTGPGEVLMTGSSVLVCVTREGKVRELPEWLVGVKR